MVLTRKSNYHNLNVSIIKYFATEYSNRNTQLICSYCIPKSPPIFFTVCKMYHLSCAQSQKPPDPPYNFYYSYLALSIWQPRIHLKSLKGKQNLNKIRCWNKDSKESFACSNTNLIEYNTDFNILFYIQFDTVRYSWFHSSGSDGISHSFIPACWGAGNKHVG